MIKRFCFFLLVFAINYVNAQAPQGIPYQAAARYANGQPMINKIIMVRFSILDNAANGTVVYKETHNTSTNALGIFNINVGMGNAITGTMSSVNWGVNSKFLKVEMDTAGTGISYTDLGTQQMMSVPFALYANTAATTNINTNGLFVHYVGELYQGGIVVAVWKKNGTEHGLIASLVDVSSGAAWSNNTSTLIGSTAQSPRDGQANTTAIISQSGATSGAAQLCDVYANGGYSDWYLPAAWELNICYNVASIVNEILGDTNGFQFTSYWSSNEADNAYSWIQYFGSGYTDANLKGGLSRVRAVRKF